MDQHPVYLDHNGTTPVDPAVLEAMLPYLREEFGNPSSATALGRRAREAVETAREAVAALIGARAEEVTFTSGGTEASNIAIRGAAARRGERPVVVTSTIEHPATEACCALLERDGMAIRRIPPGPDGCLDPARVEAGIDGRTALVTLIHAQNEIGTLQPIAEVSRAARRAGALVHADAAQSVGKVAVEVDALGVDLLTIAGHKLYAPKGIGALYARTGTGLAPLLVGAGQERGRRPGTENVAFIAGLGAACRIAAARLAEDAARQDGLARHLLRRLREEVPGLILVGHPERRLPNTVNVLFPGVTGNALLAACPEILASTGSACHAGSDLPSAILLALGLAPDRAVGAVRLSLGRTTSGDEIDRAARSLAAAWRRLAAREAA
ncbi:cysteine desulfurase family protein [Enterovirga rhinocerotis]|uniref:Cysteine desulfurase n=1 Tax=Enterovirga rhinocerotis TaxID=1339210 RepID=A0A4R7BI01_9HYPH|nr:cysteine desulfurase family protein [Enterovirga rhinocerotis]TDR84553.1 cysteine desulfurase [Enterovirga rhinocerotis]